MLIKRQLPVLNAAIIYMKTNIESASRDTSSELDTDNGPVKKLSVRFTRLRTRSTLIQDEKPPIELNQVSSCSPKSLRFLLAVPLILI